ncbi:MAG: hypothetical protein IJV31_04415 [Clostridia bacterium]|nr:hypothetical protein [Clostridia bacterium]
MKNLIIDERIRQEEFEYLRQYFNIKKMPLSEDVYEEISGHSDIFYCKINKQIICAPNAPIIEKNFIIGNAKVERSYPKDIFYNACQIGKNIIGSEYTDSKIPVNIKVRQGYTKCSIAVTSENSCITTDKWIAKKLKLNNIDTTYINEPNIKLLKKSGQVSKISGFIGGATFCFDNNFVIFGDIEKLKSQQIILEHLNKYNLNLVHFRGLDVYDYGGAIEY